MKSKSLHTTTRVAKGFFTKSVHLGLNLAFGQPDRPEAGTRPYGNGILAAPVSVPDFDADELIESIYSAIKAVEDQDPYGN